MTQAGFSWDPPIQQGGSLRSRHASSEGAKAAGEVVARQMLTVLAAYKSLGPSSDAQVAAYTGIERSSVIPRRRAFMDRGLVMEIGHAKNEQTGVTNTTYGLA